MGNIYNGLLSGAKALKEDGDWATTFINNGYIKKNSNMCSNSHLRTYFIYLPCIVLPIVFFPLHVLFSVLSPSYVWWSLFYAATDSFAAK